MILKKDSNIPKHPQLPLNPLFQSISLSLYSSLSLSVVHFIVGERRHCHTTQISSSRRRRRRRRRNCISSSSNCSSLVEKHEEHSHNQLGQCHVSKSLAMNLFCFLVFLPPIYDFYESPLSSKPPHLRFGPSFVLPPSLGNMLWPFVVPITH